MHADKKIIINVPLFLHILQNGKYYAYRSSTLQGVTTERELQVFKGKPGDPDMCHGREKS